MMKLPQFKKFLQMLLLVSGLSAGLAWAQEQGTPAEAKAMVQRTIDSMKKNGVDSTVADINKKDGKYQDRDLYIVVYDINGKNLAHINPKMIGKDLSDLKDADGKYFVRERIELVKKKGSGWQDYKFVNPVSKQIEPKSMYVEKYEGVIVGCGVYKKE